MSLMRFYQSSDKNTVVLSLGTGDLLLESVREAARRLDLHTGVLLTGIGSFSRAAVAGVAGKREIQGPLEVLSVSGIVADYEPHLHVSMLDSKGAACGGHVEEGCVILTVAELALQRVPDLKLAREIRDGSAYKLLTLRKGWT